MKEFNKTNNRELMTRICDAEQEVPNSGDAICLNYEWLYKQIEELCIPISQLEELIQGKQNLCEDTADLQELVDNAKRG